MISLQIITEIFNVCINIIILSFVIFSNIHYYENYLKNNHIYYFLNSIIVYKLIHTNITSI